MSESKLDDHRNRKAEKPELIKFNEIKMNQEYLIAEYTFLTKYV